CCAPSTCACRCAACRRPGRPPRRRRSAASSPATADCRHVSGRRSDRGGCMAHMLIIGGGMAGGTAAATLRDSGFDGEVTVVAAEGHPPYQRPPLSKGFLAGSEGLDAVHLHPADWY